MLLYTILTSAFIRKRNDDDIIDRLHYYVTANVLIVLAVLVSFKQFGGHPIECLIPDIFPGAWEQYAEKYCWAQDTYYVPMTQKVIPLKSSDRHQARITYYKWVPFFLLIQAACFHTPSILWKLFSTHSGIKIGDIVNLSKDKENIRPSIRKNTVKILANHLEQALKFHRRCDRRHIVPHKHCRPCNVTYSAIYVSVIYLLAKLLYFVNAIAQWLLLNEFLINDDNYSWYGYDAVRDMLKGATWHHSGLFPIVSLCDFQARTMGSNVQNYTMQCVLVINLFNEKIFIALWFWYIILAIITVISFIYWCSIIIPIQNETFILRFIQSSEMKIDVTAKSKQIRKFVHGYLQSDGVLAISMIVSHSGIMFGTEVVTALWQSFYGIETGSPHSCPSVSCPYGYQTSSATPKTTPDCVTPAVTTSTPKGNPYFRAVAASAQQDSRTARERREQREQQTNELQEIFVNEIDETKDRVKRRAPGPPTAPKPSGNRRR